MQINEIMSRDVQILEPNTSIRDCARAMRDQDIGALPVGENDRLLGMVTDRDIVTRCVADGKLDNSTVRDAMSDQVLYCYDDDDIENVARNMSEQQVRRLPVVNHDKRLVGIVSLADIARNSQSRSPGGEALKGISQPSGGQTRSM